MSQPGGGGAPRAPLAPESRRRHGDDLFSGPSLRAFHYLRVAPRAGGVDVEVVGLAKRARELAPIDRFSLSYAAGAVS